MSFCLHKSIFLTIANPVSLQADAVEAILNTGKAPVNVLVGGITALVIAADDMRPAVIEVLLRHGADPSSRVEKERWYSVDATNEDIKMRSDSTTGPTAMHFYAGKSSKHIFLDSS